VHLLRCVERGETSTNDDGRLSASRDDDPLFRPPDTLNWAGIPVSMFAPFAGRLMTCIGGYMAGARARVSMYVAGFVLGGFEGGVVRHFEVGVNVSSRGLQCVVL
jgi:hypothetical protein